MLEGSLKQKIEQCVCVYVRAFADSGAVKICGFAYNDSMIHTLKTGASCIKWSYG